MCCVGNNRIGPSFSTSLYEYFLILYTYRNQLYHISTTSITYSDPRSAVDPVQPRHFDIVKLASRDTPPPLHFSPATSDLERTSTTDSTPVGTPRAFDAQCGKRSQKERDKEKDLLFSWHRKSPSGFAGGASSFVDTTLLEAGFDDSTYPLFSEEPFELDMAGMSSPIDITSKDTSARGAQHSRMLGPRNGDDVQATAMDIVNGTGRPSRATSGRLDSISEAQAPGAYSSGAQPMSLSKDRPRRESIASSMVGGMSFGGISVGSWIRDE